MTRRNESPRRAHQQGQAILILVLVLFLAGVSFLVHALSQTDIRNRQAAQTAQALAEAKAALIGYAASVNISTSLSSNPPRPGDLPCPDNHALGSSLAGTSSTPCSGSVIGRLPWRTLDLPDLRDGAGYRLWYAVSSNFKNSPRSGTLNSTTNGTITVRDAGGQIIYDGAGTTGAVAVILAPGSALTRTDGVQQVRDNAGYGNPVNYLDIANNEDNSNFVDGSSANGFIQGPISLASGPGSFNDSLLIISREEILSKVYKRVAGELAGNSNPIVGIQDYYQHHGYYPWAGNSSGTQVPNLLSGSIPYQDISYDSATRNSLLRNGWFIQPNTVYTVSSDQLSAVIATGNPAAKICLNNGAAIRCP